MRTVFLLFVFLPAYLFSIAQNNLSDGRRASVYTYIYKITKQEATTLYKSGMSKANEKYLHSIVDSFKTDSEDVPKLIPGDYLFAHASNNSLVFEFHSEGDVECKLINNNRDLVIALHTKTGELISDAEVLVRNKKVAFDKSIQSYRLSKFKREGLIKVSRKDAVYFFPITKNKFKHPLQLQYKPPFKYVIRPVKKLFEQRKNYYRNYYYGRTPYETSFRGFMVFNKPKYKPGDTVFLKAFVETKQGKPIMNDLLLRLSDKYFNTDTIIARIHPYRNGGYEYKFVLNDSLDIDLDDEYVLTLEELRSKKYDLDSYDGNLDDEEYAMRRKVVMRGKFFYEDYELGQINFFARSDKAEHRRKELAAIYLKANDENDMAVMDGRVQILVSPSYGSPEFHAQKVFLPDTLWYHEQNLDQIGETKIVLPDSIFPKTSFDYSVECFFLNSNNESQTKNLQQKFIDEDESIRFTILNDSLKIERIVDGESKATTGNMYVFADKDYEDTLEQKPITFPATLKVNPFAKMYEVETENLDEDFEIKQNKGMISCLALRTKDSVTIQLQNPYHLQVWYNVFAGNKIIARGLTQGLLFKEKVRTKKNYFVSLQYIWGNKVWNEDYTIPYQDKLLTISVNQPQFIYPGQTTQIDIDVKNASGKPLADADVTAFSFTKKFKDAGVPYVPYLGKIYPGRTRYANFDEREKDDVEGYIKLNWQRWSKEMRLDTIEYFKFLHPQIFYRNVEPAKDSITQIAPFIVVNGDIQPIQQIYIDEVPVFFSQAQQLQRYSFRVSPGRHSFRFRTKKSMIRLDSFFVDKGVKTFLSVNGDTSNKRIRIEKMPDTLTAYEKILWSRYMILIENNFGENYAYTKQNENIYLLNDQNKFWASPILAGPFPNQYASLVLENKFTQPFEAEGAYQYVISQGLIKQKQLRNSYPFNSRLSGQIPGYGFDDFVLTEDEVDSLWEKYLEYRSINQDLFYNSYLDKYGNGKLQIGVSKDHKNDSVVIKNILLFRTSNPDFIRAYKGSARDLGYVQPGLYRLFFLLRDDKYFIKDSIVVLKNGINYYETGIIAQKPKDSISIRISEVIKNLSSGLHSSQSPQMDQIKELFNDKYLNELSFDKTISGIVRDDQGNPIAGASIMIKGTRIGVSTDVHGNFILKAPSEGSIVISSIGYSSQELRTNNAIGQYSLTLVPNKASLSEVVVVGYGVQKKKELTYSVSSVSSEMLMGRVAGLTVQADSIVMPVRIRGVASLKFSSGALFVVDGIPVDQNVLKQLDGNQIENVSVLTDQTATAIYGSQAANGVVIITTKKGALKSALPNSDLPFAGNSLRNNFRDYAYWQPHLKTDENGKASFKVTFPDDITNWRTFVIAMTDKKQTGFQEGFIKSFKTISANIALPQFAVEGDSINIIGKSLNYQMDSVVAKRSFFINDVVVKQNQIGFRNAWIDTFLVVSPAAKDSMKMKYTIEKDNGYFDGEERTIPVFKQGVLETSGFFAALNKDTSFSFRLSNDTNTVKLYAEASLLPVWEDEIESIRNYEYLCNEQLASKLKALLVEKKIDSFLNRNFKGEKNILDIISKLNQNKAQSGLWGWWNNTETSLWISLHVIEALTEAEQMGYKTSINKPLLVDYLVYNLESYHPSNRLTALNLLYRLGAKVDFKKYADSIAKDSSKMSMYEKLRLAELKQKTGLSISLDSLLRKQNHTAFGNIYWGEDNYRFFDNDIQNTLIIYRLLRAQKADDALLQKVRNYFLEKRKTGHWRNTYESSLILETILPDLLVNDSIPKPSSITISGKKITQFPFAQEIKGGQNISISKQGTLPVYFTAYEQHWNSAPKKIDGNFEVTSFFENNRSNVTKLKAGEPVSLKVNIRVNADADYVMLEVPIPAGCSYKEKNQSYSNNEVHREYFKNKVSIFCGTLKKGEYVFSVSLLPRYTGKYNLNPSKAEMMYFPVFFGREGMKKIIIE